MHRNALIGAIAAVCCGVANAGIHIEIAAMNEGPDGADTFGAAIGQTDTLGVWIWSDEPGVEVFGIEFDLVGTVFGQTTPNPSLFEIQSLGTADPSGAFSLLADPGDLIDSSRIANVIMLTLPIPSAQVAIPSSRDSALLIYDSFTGMPHTFLGGVTANAFNISGAAGAYTDIEVHGWYQIPAPGTLAAVGGLGLLAARRRRIS